MSERRPDLRIVPKNEQQPKARLLPDYKRISTMLVGHNGSALWGKAGPFVLSEQDFHDLSEVARRLANGGRV